MDHQPQVPAVDFGKQEKKKREVVTVVVEDERDGMVVLDDMERGVRIAGYDIWRLPRGEVRKPGMFGSGQSMMNIFNVFKKLEGRGTVANGIRLKTGNRQKADKQRIAVLDGEGSEYLTIGTAAKLFGKGIKSNMGGMEGMEEELKVYSRYVMSLEHCMCWNK